jgi:cytidyltransferase-like protein
MSNLNKDLTWANGFIDGCFDLFHYGHVNAIYQSKLKCNNLILATHDNEEIYKAKKCQPVYDFNERLLILKTCKFIDKLNLESTPYNTDIDILNKNHCDIFFHGDDGIDKYPLIDIYKLNKLSIFDRTKGISTSNLLQRIYNYINNDIVKMNDNIDYLNSLYNNIISLSNKLYISKPDSRIVYLKCDWDLFNKFHIYLLQDIKKKYPHYKLCIDLISPNDINSNILFNKYEIKILLAGIKHIDMILFDTSITVNCTHLVLINTSNDNIFNQTVTNIDDSFQDSIYNIINMKLQRINKIDFMYYTHKLISTS